MAIYGPLMLLMSTSIIYHILNSQEMLSRVAQSLRSTSVFVVIFYMKKNIIPEIILFVIVISV